MKIKPVEYNVLVKPDVVEEKTKGGLILPDQTKEGDRHAQTRGVIEAVSPHAFSYADWGDVAPPKVGDRVIYGKYAGVAVMDGEIEYRLVNDKAIAAVIEE